jgi:hypothetical protein
MKTYEFSVVLAGLSSIDDDLVEALYEAGCDDGTPISSGGVAWIGFSRESASLEEAIRSAIADVQKAGCAAARVEIEADSSTLQNA